MDTRWSKRKRDDWDDEDNGDERTGAQVLPVARSLPADGIPRDGSEYLLMVRYVTVVWPPHSALLTPAYNKKHRSDCRTIFYNDIQDGGGETPRFHKSGKSIWASGQFYSYEAAEK